MWRVAETGIHAVVACLCSTLPHFARGLVLVIAHVVGIGVLLGVRPYRFRSAFVLDVVL